MTVAAILKVKGSHVETTRPDTTLYSVASELKTKNIGALVVVSDAGATILGMISERDLVRGSVSTGRSCRRSPCTR
jgi:CBS domain-containing protein